MQTGGEGGGSGGSAGAGSYRTLRSRRETPSIGEINVTPLVDVVLVLLIIFMVTAPMMSRGIDVNLPVATQTENPPKDLLTVSVTAEGRIYVSDRAVNLALLEDHLRGVLGGRQAKVVLLRADERLIYGKVIEVMDKMKNAGVEQIGFAYVLPDEKKAGK
jgi:biopolymer transport protein ExbD